MEKSTDGNQKKVELIKYDDGSTVKRTYPTPDSIIPEDAHQMEHREVELYKRYFPQE
jgi:hypothetical protein